MIRERADWIWQSSALSQTHHVWGRFDHERPTYNLGYVLAFLAAAGILVAAAIVLIRWRRSFRTNSKRSLFRELCRAHRLPASSCRLLMRLAAARGLSNPSLLFVEPRYFETNNLPQPLHAAKSELQRVHGLLFE
jgi:hypothetical protein